MAPTRASSLPVRSCSARGMSEARALVPLGQLALDLLERAAKLVQGGFWYADAVIFDGDGDHAGTLAASHCHRAAVTRNTK